MKKLLIYLKTYRKEACLAPIFIPTFANEPVNV